MEENHMGWKLVKGVRRDVTNLFKSFSKTDSVRYEDFCKVWKDMKFSLIYSNRTSFIELLEFTEEILQIVKEYLLSVYEFDTRVAALYTLYGLYFKQPIREAAKIRFTKSEWEEVYSLIATCKAEKHHDVVYIHLKMYLAGAYNFTASVRPFGLERGFRKYSEKKSNFLPESIDKELLNRPLITKDLVNSLIKLESLYCKKKAELLGKRNLVFIDGTFAKSLQQELQSYACDSENNKTDEAVTETTQTESRGGVKSKAGKDRLNINENDDNVEEMETNLGRNQRKRVAKYMDLLAKKKAELYLKKIRKENEQGSSSEVSFQLPELDSD